MPAFGAKHSDPFKERQAKLRVSWKLAREENARGKGYLIGGTGDLAGLRNKK